MKNNKEPSHKWLKKAEDICDLNQGVAAHLPVTGESEAIGFATFLEDGNFYKSEERGVRYYHNKEGKFTKPELYNLYKQSKK